MFLYMYCGQTLYFNNLNNVYPYSEFDHFIFFDKFQKGKTKTKLSVDFKSKQIPEIFLPSVSFR